MPKAQDSRIQGSRNVAVMRGIAGLLLNASLGERFDRMADLQARFGVGVGTIHTAIRNIEQMGAVSLRRAGHQGTFIESLDLKQLWAISGRAPLVGAFPQFAAPEMRDARTMLRGRISGAGVPFTTVEQAGSIARITAVLRGNVDFAILSNGVVDQIDPELREQLSVFCFDEGSYYFPESLVILHRRGTDPHGGAGSSRTGIDPHSSDHFRLSVTEFAGIGPTDMVECNYPDIPRLILEDRIDRAVWHRIDTIVPLELIGMDFALLSSAAAKDLLARISRMALITRTEDSFIGTLALGDRG